MLSKKRMLFGVITTEANRAADRPLLEGIIAQAKEYDINTAVISNLYNTNETCDELFCENMIYKLIESPLYDGFILIAESIINPDLIQLIQQYLAKTEIPIVVIGNANEAFQLPHARFINSSDENDMAEVTEHMITVHGCRDIALLTGPENKPESHLRIEGYRRALERHGIEFDDSKVYFGSFWLDSGETLARKYIFGELPYPEALVCANDYMAFGFLDEFERNGVNILEKIAVIGYENADERTIHEPMITTYSKNKKSLGRSAVKILYEKVVHQIDIDFTPPVGALVHGLSCGCGNDTLEVHQEILYERIRRKYDTWTVYAPMEQRLTGCNTMSAFIKEAGEYQYLIRYVQDIYLCLYENWYEMDNRKTTENMIRYNIMPWEDSTPFSMKHNQFQEITARSDCAAAYYFSPIFFNEMSLGYAVLKYDNPDAYDDNFRIWLKTVSNCLVFLCMKNDIRYLTQCQNLSETKDSLTGLNNNNGLEKAFRSLTSQKLFFVVLKICLFRDEFADFDKSKKIASVLDVADALLQFCGKRSSVCGRIEDTVFGCIIQSDSVSCEQLTDHLRAILTQHKTYLKDYGIDSFLCCAVQIEQDETYIEVLKRCTPMIQSQIEEHFDARQKPNYATMLKIRNAIYLDSDIPNPTEEMCRRYAYSPGYLRTTYKNCFDISLHKDYINSKIAKAKYLLCTTNMTVAAIAAECSYDKDKHFLHQFKTLTGVTPNMYRALHVSQNAPK